MSDEVAVKLTKLVSSLRRIGTDTAAVEVKASVGKLPKSTAETLSAFANGSGGWLVLGLDEDSDFSPARGFKAEPIREALAGACSDRLMPPLRPQIDIVPFESAEVVVAQLDPIPPLDKPCYIKERGRYQGSFIRTGDGDRRLASYEIDRLLEEHRQPHWDEELVADAALDDLDPVLVESLVLRQRRIRPRVFGSGESTVILQRLKVIRADEQGVLRPTLAGLLALGVYPQEFFPRLTLTFAAYPGLTKAPVDGQLRMLDSVTLAGPVPALIEDAMAAVGRNSRVGARLRDGLRVDVPDYPPDAVREAVTNALMHRDLSELSRGTQVQVNLYLDRLEVLSPGGLYGTVTIERLGQVGVSSARNQRLSTLLEDVAYPGGGMVAENRGSGYALMEAELFKAGMHPPVPIDDIASFSLTMYRPGDKLRVVNTYESSAVGTLLAAGGLYTASELVKESGLSRSGVIRQVNQLMESGRVEATAPVRSPRRKYRWVGEG